MARPQTFGAVIACVALLTACSPGTPSATADPCRIAPIRIDFRGLPPTPLGGPLEEPVPVAGETDWVGPFKPPDFKSPLDAVVTGTQPGGNGQTIKQFEPLLMVYTDPARTSIAGCPVRLRSFGQELVGPTFRVKPGETLKFSFDNTLSHEAVTHATHSDPRTAADWDVTNLHTHGLHVFPGKHQDDRDPAASDNVLLRIPSKPKPQNPQPYEIAIPPDHPSGTFWYHPHVHGSTAVQVSSGMAGAIIVEDDPNKLPAALKDIEEKVMIFQTIFYNEDKQKKGWAEAKDPASGGWQESLRRVTINGQMVPKITMQPGEVQRWRMIGSMFNESLRLKLSGHELHEIALDGLYLPRVDTWKDQTIDLHAGYRSDVLVQASMNRGTYLLLDERTPAALAKDNIEEDRSIVAVLVVDGKPKPMQLPTNEQMSAIAFQPDVNLKELWHAPSPEPRGTQEVIFDVAPRNPDRPHESLAAVPPIPDPDSPGLPGPVPSPRPSEPVPRGTEMEFVINGVTFSPKAAERPLVLNQIDRWLVTAAEDNHVFHIHTNPFQVKQQRPHGTEWVWKDTIFVQGREQPPYPNPHVPRLPPLELYTKYDTKYDDHAPYDAAQPPFNNFAGRYVIHCHFLDHEDFGMMQIMHLQ
jgi:FtsP/CotA-like multicopper oxidase with cupredoxin domain